MPPERHPPDDAREWLNRARSNLIQARGHQTGVYLEDLCFQAQQAAEKALKALLLHHGIRFPYIHDLAELINLLEQGGVKPPARVREAVRLNEYAVAARYPGLAEPVSPEEYREALRLADEAVSWVDSTVSSKEEPQEDAGSPLQDPAPPPDDG